MELPADLTAKKVLNAYIEAIGGMEAVSAVNAYEVQAVAEIQGMQLELKLDKAGERQFTQELNMMGSTMQKAVIDGNSGYQLNQGQRKDLSAEEVEEALEESAFVKELLWLNRDEISLIGIENVNGVDAYALQVSEKRKAFYAVETGLKLQETVSIEMQGQSFEQNTMYDDYRPVSGVLYPYKLTQSLGPQLLDFIVEKAVIK
jgi:zinc protease